MIDLKKKIPLGFNSYARMKKENYYVVDKSMIIKDFLDRGNAVTLMTRPRRFGKTINMSMLSEFFRYYKGFKTNLSRYKDYENRLCLTNQSVSYNIYLFC